GELVPTPRSSVGSMAGVPPERLSPAHVEANVALDLWLWNAVAVVDDEFVPEASRPLGNGRPSTGGRRRNRARGGGRLQCTALECRRVRRPGRPNPVRQGRTWPRATRSSGDTSVLSTGVLRLGPGTNKQPREAAVAQLTDPDGVGLLRRRDQPSSSPPSIEGTAPCRWPLWTAATR